ncbi:UDP-glucose 4-epimerase family protein [Phytopseudomonas punonensis]|uniref:Nucleoside-diphosphate-sugar epimerase n=1 Tax=Phytopseudomonas punonensis TaxID=1220495 RepID=A0A1M7M3T7_9GAMM|nr:SDR family oxidoreductase [Pseudomonas punonensis]SHM85338.1 Nucleoside-diphosphate-sugar epimerase [Pseudomonas punonensis]
MRILVTGAGGFVGQALVGRLTNDPRYQPRAASRNVSAFSPKIENCLAPSLGSNADWHAALSDVSVVVHLAARVHVMNDTASDPLVEFRNTNVAGTLNLARQAATAGVQRFIFISSIKVNGEGTEPGHPYRADDTPAPQDPYGVSKMEAEQGLRALAGEAGMEVVIIRPVLVYGPGVKANFRSMMSWLRKGIPLPLGATGNKRSLVAVDNLVDLIATCIDHPAAANQTFLVSDGDDLSTTQLLQRMGTALGRPARLLPVPASLLQACAAMLGKRAIAQRLCGSLQVDIGKTRELLAWAPPVSVDEALRKTARAFDAG